jgi:predicted short-subunit dehydrogenase-like oxidoreductase (DUF2520 family)
MAKVNIIGRGRAGSALSLAHTVAGDQLCADANTVIFAVPDDNLEDAVLEYLAANDCAGKFIVHLSGMHSLEVLGPLSDAKASTAALHPIIQFVNPSDDIEQLKQCYVSCLANDEQARQMSFELVAKWQSQMIDLDRSVDRRQYHLALSLASNHVTALMAWAQQLLEPSLGEASLEVVSKMAERAVATAATIGPMASLTGPVARGDVKTIAAHLESLDDEQRHRYSGLLLNLQALVDEHGE